MSIFKKILFTTMRIINLGLCFITACCFMWYILPSIKTCKLGAWILSFSSELAIFWSFIGCGFGFVLFLVLDAIFNKTISSKGRNLFIHLYTWTWCLICIAAALTTFMMINPIVTSGITINTTQKVLISILVIALVVYHLISDKLVRIINRKIQSYENAKESGVIGRSSIIWVNMLKVFEILLPEILILMLMCLIVSWDVSGYFAVLLLGCLIPMIGNIVCDFNVRREITIRSMLKDKRLANNVRDKIINEL